MLRLPLVLACLATPAAAQGAAQAPASANDPSLNLSRVEKRHRLAACATEWQRMKRTGTEGALIWRDFSATCLARQR